MREWVLNGSASECIPTPAFYRADGPCPPDVETASGSGDAKPEQRRSAVKPPHLVYSLVCPKSGEIA